MARNISSSGRPINPNYGPSWAPRCLQGLRTGSTGSKTRQNDHMRHRLEQILPFALPTAARPAQGGQCESERRVQRLARAPSRSGVTPPLPRSRQPNFDFGQHQRQKSVPDLSNQHAALGTLASGSPCLRCAKGRGKARSERASSGQGKPGALFQRLGRRGALIL
jgi:hypothetical protein